MAKFKSYPNDTETVWYNGYFQTTFTDFGSLPGWKRTEMCSCPYTERWETPEEAKAAAESYAHGGEVFVCGFRWEGEYRRWEAVKVCTLYF